MLGFFATLAFTALSLTFEAIGQDVIFVGRHADPIDGPIRDDTPLSESGRLQAETLSKRLKDAGITAIYTSKTVRTIQTAEPLAKRLGLRINSISRRNTDGLIRRLREKHTKDRVLVVGHWPTVPEILRGLGYPKKVKLKRTVRNDLFVVVSKPGGPPAVVYIHW